jgi:hypothetical protein
MKEFLIIFLSSITMFLPIVIWYIIQGVKHKCFGLSDFFDDNPLAIAYCFVFSIPAVVSLLVLVLTFFDSLLS